MNLTRTLRRFGELLGVCSVAQGGTGATSAAAARTNLGLGTAATHAAGDFAHTADNLSDLADPSAARTNLGLGTAATADAGAFLAPAGDGSALTGLTETQVTGLSADLAARALDAAVVHTTGNETVAGVKTFSSTIVGDISGVAAGLSAPIAESQVTSLVADLAARALDAAVVHTTGAETVAGIKTFTTAGTYFGNAAAGARLTSAAAGGNNIWIEYIDGNMYLQVVGSGNLQATTNTGILAINIGPDQVMTLSGGLKLATLSDAAAPNGTLYLGSDHLDANSAPKLCHRDAAANITVIGPAAAAGTGGQLQYNDAGSSGGSAATITAAGALVLHSDPGANHSGPFACLTLGDVIGGETNGCLMAFARVNPAHVPITGYTGFDDGTARFLYFGGGGWGTTDANHIYIFTDPSTGETADGGVLRIHVFPDGTCNFNPAGGNANLDAAAGLTLRALSTATKGYAFRPLAGQTAPAFEVQDSSGTAVADWLPDGSFRFARLADTDAVNDSTYYSTTQSKLVYKDSVGTANPLY